MAAQAEAGIRRAQAELQAQRNEELTGEGEQAAGTSDDINAVNDTGEGREPVVGESSGPPNDGFSETSEQDRASERPFGLVSNLIDIAV